MTGYFDRRAFLGSAGALAGSIAFGGANPALAEVRSQAGPGAAFSSRAPGSSCRRMQAAIDQGSVTQRDATFSPQRPTIGSLKFSAPFVPGPGNALRQWCENTLLAARPERRPRVLSYFTPSRKEEIARVGFVDPIPYRFEIDQIGSALHMNVDLSVRMITVT